MRTGKEKCEILKALRKDIAAKNNIPFEPNVCTHQGECRGTCPACESEVNYLERMLSRIESTGKKPQLVGISACLAAMVPVALSCTGNTQKAPGLAASPVSVSQEVQSADSIALSPYDPEQENDILVGRSVPVDTLEAEHAAALAQLTGIIDEDEEVTDTPVEVVVIEEVGMAFPDDYPGEVVEVGREMGDHLPEVEEERVDEADDYVIREDPAPYLLVEKRPDFNGGGLPEFAKWVKDNLDKDKYNDCCSGCTGKIVVECMIEKDGTLTNARILRGIDPTLDRMVIDVVASSPRWTPGTQNGKPVRVLIPFPIQFP